MHFKTEGGVTAPLGFAAMGVHAGIKKEKTDMAMIKSHVPAVAAGTFTTNVVKAAPVLFDQKQIYENDFAQVIVCNSGVANACTGKEGMDYCAQTAKLVAENLQIDERTGRIVMMGALDNLVKGAAGQAVQNMNIMFGLPEETGIDLVPSSV